MSHTVITNENRCLRVVASGIVGDPSTVEGNSVIPQKQIDLCHQWLSRATVARPPQFSSFWVKHVVENWAGQEISNGALIVAAFEAGFEISKPNNDPGANVSIGLDSIDLREFDCGCGHP
ncbi:MAG TPA: hypothetical protein DEF45_13875 [Rhodopirellula sp.]|nr:hypothetical protein [Rhodopirellula sp.]